MTQKEFVPVVICADDFGLSRGVNAGILELAGTGRISAVGCMTALPAFAVDATRLSDCAATIDLGVHLTLTDQEPLTTMPGLAPAGKLPSLGRLLKLGLTGGLPIAEIQRETEAQINRFVELTGRFPDFIDGHQHVQQLPGVNRIFVETVAGLNLARPPYIRVCNDRITSILKRRRSAFRALAIGAFGYGLQRRVRRRGLLTNSGFAGFYDYSGTVDFASAFPDFLVAAVPNTLIFCHPGHSDDELVARDSLTTQRDRELEFMAGDGFHDMLEKAGVRLARFCRS
ncbi:MAG: ChbG/HpnK family deacetylase [Rhodospirillales bacterium]